MSDSSYDQVHRPRWGWRLLLSAALVMVLSAPASAQQSVSGTVIHARSRSPVRAATVSVEGTDIRVTTDREGAFTVRGIPAGQVTLIVIRIGFRPQTIRVAAGTSGLVVALQESAISLDEIVVTGTAGAQTARSIGNAVDILDVDDLVRIAPPRNMQQLISAQVPGLRIMAGGGSVGSGGTARIRGVTSLTLSAVPLVYVDGIRVNGADNDITDAGSLGISFFSGVDSRNRPARLNDFNPEDIESIEVIKGPAAATLYGTEASNGVIQIITKRGRRGRAKVDLNVRQGALWLPDPETTFPPTFYQEGGLFSGGNIVEFNVLEEDRKLGNIWFRNGHLQSYGAAVSGGGEDMQYYISADWDRDEGPVPYNWQNSLSGRANLTYAPSQDFELKFSLGTVRSTLSSASASQPLPTAIIWACPASGCEPGAGGPNDLLGPTRGYIAYLPEVYEDDVEGFETVDRTTLSVQARHNPLEWLTHRLVVGTDIGTVRDTYLARATGSQGNLEGFGAKSDLNIRNTFVSFDYGATATYDKLNNIGFVTSGGVQIYRKQKEIIWARGEQFPVAALETISSGATRTAAERFLENRTFGMYLQEQISWKDRIFFTGAVRGDDNSSFGANFDFVVYPKFSGSWVISDEPFFDNNIVNSLKLRAAWGKAGQQPDVFAAARTYQPAIGRGGTATLTPSNSGNPDIKPEVGVETEVGFDASLIDERVGIEFTYYNQRRKDAIVQVPVVPSTGFPGSQFQNLGEIKSNGWELGLSGSILEEENVGLDLHFTYSRTKNEITDLGGNAPTTVGLAFSNQWHVEGFPIASIFQKTVVSADIITGAGGFPVADPATLMCEGGTVLPDSPNLSRGGGAPVLCSVAPAVYIGQPIPTWEGSGSATLTLFKNLRMYALVDYVGGSTVLMGDAFTHNLFLNSRAILERTDPILLGYAALGAEGLGQPLLWDPSLIKLRTLSATYNLPTQWARKIGAARAALTVAGENIATLWQAQTESFGHGIMGVERFHNSSSSSDTEGLSAFTQEGWPQNSRFITTLRVTF